MNARKRVEVFKNGLRHCVDPIFGDISRNHQTIGQTIGRHIACDAFICVAGDRKAEIGRIGSLQVCEERVIDRNEFEIAGCREFDDWCQWKRTVPKRRINIAVAQHVHHIAEADPERFKVLPRDLGHQHVGVEHRHATRLSHADAFAFEIRDRGHTAPLHRDDVHCDRSD